MMPKEIAALMTEKGYVIYGSGWVMSCFSRDECKPYEVDDKLVCVAGRKNKYDDDRYEPFCCEG